MLQGGYQYDGVSEISGLDHEEIRQCVDSLWGKGIKNFVVSGIFSPVNPAQEIKVKYRFVLKEKEKVKKSI